MRFRVRAALAGLSVLGLGLAVGPRDIDAAGEKDRTLSIYNIHTKEKVSVVYKRDGRPVPAALKQINHVMRDWRQNEESEIDASLLDIMWEMHAELGSREPIHLISGYRSRRTNDGLREKVGGQAQNSRHILGKAADIHFPDVPIKRLRYSALVRERGGVGYYPTSAIPFVHVDTDRVRHWPPMPRYELALLFPNGQTRHLPSDGTPITREDVRVAQSRHKELAVQIAEFFQVRQRPDAARTVLASLSGPHPIAAPAIAAAPAPLAPKVPEPKPVLRPQLASLTGGPMPSLGGLVSRVTGRREAEDATAKAPAAAAPAPAVPAAARPAPVGVGGDQLGALLAREVAALDKETGGAGRASAAKVPDKTPHARVAALDPSAGIGAAPASEPTPRDPLAGEALRAWPTGYVHAPAFDEEHPEELSYRPFSIGPILTEHMGHDHPVLAALRHPDTARVFELLDEPERLFPLAFRPGQQVAELLWAGQFNGAKVGADTLMGRLKTPGSGSVSARQVATTTQR